MGFSYIPFSPFAKIQLSPYITPVEQLRTKGSNGKTVMYQQYARWVRDEGNLYPVGYHLRTPLLTSHPISPLFFSHPAPIEYAWRRSATSRTRTKTK